MKTTKKIKKYLGISGMVLLLLLGGCKKEHSTDSTNIKKPDLLMSIQGGQGKPKVLRQSPGLKFEVKSKIIERIFPALKAIEKIKSVLNEEQGNKKKAGAITIADATFTATLNGTYYNCHAEVPQDGGPHDWYLINWNTGVYTYIGSTSDYYIDFNVNKPSMYGSYRLWAEGPNGGGFTGYQYLGDPYVGVSIAGGMLEFSDQTSLNNIITRLESAFEDHQRNFFDPWDHLTDEQMTDYAESQGYDEFLPLKEFESFFGLNSLRQLVETEEIAWLNQSDPFAQAVFPDDKYEIDDEVERTVYNQYSQLKVAGVLIQPISAIEYPEEPIPCTEFYACYEKRTIVDKDTIAPNMRITRKITKKKGGGESGGGQVFASYVKGKVRRFEKMTNGGRWRKHATKMSARIYGNIYEWGGPYTGNCSTLLESFSKLDPLKRGYHRKAKKQWWQYTYARSCDVHAEFIVNGNSSTIDLR